MITYKEACDAVGYDPEEKCPIENNPVFFAYKNGEAKEFKTREDAIKFSRNLEAVTPTNLEYNNWWAARRALETAANDYCYDALKKEHDDISEELFDICYSQASEQSHSYGCDEVAYTMDNLVEFAKQCRAAK
jgi:hypothetical protein